MIGEGTAGPAARVRSRAATAREATSAHGGDLWSALLRPPQRFVTSAWPWRCVAYLASGAITGMGMGLLAALPLVTGAVLAAAAVGALVLMGFVLLAVPLARWERVRLRLVDEEPLTDPHQHVRQAGAGAWLRTRLHEQVTWRELGFAAMSVFGLCWVDAGLLYAALGVPLLLIATPAYSPATDWSPWWIAGGGLLLLPVGAYLVAAWAGARAILVRAVLGPTDRELGARLSEVARSRARLVAAFERQRELIERDLHDGAQRHLVAVTMSLGLARLDLPPSTPGADLVVRAHEQADRALVELRALIRGVHPRVLTDRGLVAAVEDIAADVLVPVDVHVDLTHRLPAEVESTAYFCISEALTNVTRHSGASSARVTLTHRGGALVVDVEDDGRGGADPERGRGLAGLADRLAAVEGWLTLHSPPGGPTVVHLEIPLPREQA